MSAKRDPRHGTQESLERRAREYGHDDDDTEGQSLAGHRDEDADALGARPADGDDATEGQPGPDTDD